MEFTKGFVSLDLVYHHTCPPDIEGMQRQPFYVRTYGKHSYLPDKINLQPRFGKCPASYYLKENCMIAGDYIKTCQHGYQNYPAHKENFVLDVRFSGEDHQLPSLRQVLYMMQIIGAAGGVRRIVNCPKLTCHFMETKTYPRQKCRSMFIMRGYIWCLHGYTNKPKCLLEKHASQDVYRAIHYTKCLHNRLRSTSGNNVIYFPDMSTYYSQRNVYPHIYEVCEHGNCNGTPLENKPVTSCSVLGKCASRCLMGLCAKMSKVDHIGICPLKRQFPMNHKPTSRAHSTARALTLLPPPYSNTWSKNHQGLQQRQIDTTVKLNRQNFRPALFQNLPSNYPRETTQHHETIKPSSSYNHQLSSRNFPSKLPASFLRKIYRFIKAKRKIYERTMGINQPPSRRSKRRKKKMAKKKKAEKKKRKEAAQNDKKLKIENLQTKKKLKKEDPQTATSSFNRSVTSLQLEQ